MVKFACAGWGFRQRDAASYFAAARDLGLEFVEINLSQDATSHLPVERWESGAEALLAAASRAGVRIVAVAGGGDFSRAEAAERRAEVELAKRQIEVAGRLGAELLRLFAGWAPESAIREQTYGWVRECLGELAEHAASLGVLLAVENHGGLSGTAARCLRLLEGLPAGVGLNYDPANFRHSGEDPLAALRVLADRIVYSHWKDVRLGPDGQWQYCAVGEGLIAWQPILEELIASGYAGYWAIEYEETADPERGTRHSLGYLKRCLERLPVSR